MPKSKTAVFRILSIDTEAGSAEVEFVNPYGPVAQGRADEPDYDEFEYETPHGTRTARRPKANPNGNLIYAIDIPVAEDGSFPSPDALAAVIADHFPHHSFEQRDKVRRARDAHGLAEMAGQERKVTVHYPDPVPADRDAPLARDTPLETTQAYRDWLASKGQA